MFGFLYLTFTWVLYEYLARGYFRAGIISPLRAEFQLWWNFKCKLIKNQKVDVSTDLKSEGHASSGQALAESEFQWDYRFC
jgi:hypothetical protein